MNKFIALPVTALLFQSCATVLNTNVQKISIQTDKHTELLSVDHSFSIPGSKNLVNVTRGRDSLAIHLRTDTVLRTIHLPAHNSAAYWFNIYFNYGIGMLIDKHNPKRYAYRKRIYLEYTGNKFVVNRLPPVEKGTINWRITIPYANHFYLKTLKSYRSSAGFLGFETGLGYYYRRNHFISVDAGAATDFPIPFPAPIDYWGEHQSSSALYINVKNNTGTKSFYWGYGLSYSQLRWQKTDPSDSLNSLQEKDNRAIGFCFSSAYRVGGMFSVGLVYQPWILSITDKPRLDYQHQLTFALTWNIPLRQVVLKE